MVTSSDAQTRSSAQGLNALSWMVGSWQGFLGSRSVEETWSPPNFGSMDTMIRLSGPEGVDMIELIVIREDANDDGEPTLVLHLRQFGPALDLRNSQEMSLEHIRRQSVSFVSSEAVRRLAYTQIADDHIKVEVTIPTGDVFTAELHRV